MPDGFEIEFGCIKVFHQFGLYVQLHSFVGYICDGEYRIYDPEINKVHHLDWPALNINGALRKVVVDELSRDYQVNFQNIELSSVVGINKNAMAINYSQIGAAKQTM